jgi:hypothetical protein
MARLRWVWIIPVLAVTLASAAEGADLEGLRWLDGAWVRQTQKGSAYERWRVLGERTMEGESWQVAKDGGARKVTESLLLCEMGGEVFYISKVAENPYPVAFKLVSHTPGHALFENPTHDFPTRIGYERTEQGMTAWIEGPGEDGKPHKIEFVFERGTVP